MTNTTTTIAVDVPNIGVVDVTVSEVGDGHSVLLLHGGGGPTTVSGFADQLATDASSHARVITPTHPGFNGTPRPDQLADVAGLAALYVALLEELDLTDVTVVGNSIGGWIAAEMAIMGSPRASSYVIVDAVGLDVPGHPVVDFFSLTPSELAERSYYDPERYGIDPATLPPDAQQMMAANRQAIAVYAGQAMTDPSLASRLGTISVPTLVVWGEADRIADPDYGRAFAQAVPGAEFALLTRSGHLPQIETPEKLMRVIWNFARQHAVIRPCASRPR